MGEGSLAVPNDPEMSSPSWTVSNKEKEEFHGINA